MGRIRPSIIALFGSVSLLSLQYGPLAPAALALSGATLVSPTGEADDDRFGTSVAAAGDMNGDGHVDFIVGAPLTDTPGGLNAGRAYVFLGGPALQDRPALSLAGANPNDALFGTSVASAGDMDGDGFADVIVGAAYLDRGHAYIFRGGRVPDPVADLSLFGPPGAFDFGSHLASAGDVNADGLGDVIVGAPSAQVNDVSLGQVFLFLGAQPLDAGPDLVLAGNASGDQFGKAVAPAGDLNGDGYGDFIVGTPGVDTEEQLDVGAAYVYFGGPLPVAQRSLTLPANPGDRLFGDCVAGAGDVNGDGYDDVIVGVVLNDTVGASGGRAYVYFGGSVPDAIPDVVLLLPPGAVNFGTAVSAAGDLDRDGFGDVLVGARGLTRAGEVYGYLGGPAMDAAPDLRLAGGPSADQFGSSIAPLGDQDGDGFGDVLIGAPTDDSREYHAGRAYVMGCFPYRVLSPNGGETWIAGAPAVIRWRGRDTADVSLSLDGGRSFLPVVLGAGGAEENEVSVTAPDGATLRGKVQIRYSGQAAARSNSDQSDGAFQILPRAELRAWPIPSHGDDLSFSFAAPTGLRLNGPPAEIAIFDRLGRLVRRLAGGSGAGGYAAIGWDGRDDDGRRVASGVYFARFRQGGREERIKVVVAR